MTLNALAVLSITTSLFFNPKIHSWYSELLYQIVKTDISFKNFESRWNILLTIIIIVGINAQTASQHKFVTCISR